MHDQRMVGGAALGGKRSSQPPEAGIQRSIQNHNASLEGRDAQDFSSPEGCTGCSAVAAVMFMTHLVGALGIDLAVQVQVGTGQGQNLVLFLALGHIAVLEPQVAQQLT